MHESLVLAAVLVSVAGCPPPDQGFGTSTAGGVAVGGSDVSGFPTGGNGSFGCGDGVVDDGVEECDLGPGNADDGSCTTDCMLAACGDGLVHAGVEICDDGAQSETCDADCTVVECGDGVVNVAAGESCDTVDPDNGTCDETCTLICDPDFDDCNADPADGCEASLIDDPDNCSACGNVCETCRAGHCDAKYVFLTSEVFFGDLAGVTAADAACQDLADAAGLTGTYLAWLSSGTEQVADRFTLHDGPYIRIDGEKVADDWADLTDGLLAIGITKTETGDDPGTPDGVTCHGGPTCLWAMTATESDATSYMGQDGDCMGWTTQMSTFAGGDPTDVTVGWTIAATDLQCDTAARLYCFEQ